LTIIGFDENEIPGGKGDDGKGVVRIVPTDVDLNPDRTRGPGLGFTVELAVRWEHEGKVKDEDKGEKEIPVSWRSR
jgi:hypothetical protein